MGNVKADFVLLVACEERKGLVAAIASNIAAQDCNIIQNSQFGDHGIGRFFMRLTFVAPPGMTRDRFAEAFLPVVVAYNLDWRLHDLTVKPRAIIMVSKGGHCLNDLLYRAATGFVPMTVTSIVSNHTTWARRAEHEGIPFHHLPVTPDSKAAAEAGLLALIEQQAVDVVILARYMQVLSQAVCHRLKGQVINIHHSSLPAFKGAMPYHRAFDRGVKMVGATAHYVTDELDEGPIIAQDCTQIDHADTVDDLIAQGQETECSVLTKAVKAHCEHRVMLHAGRTVVFK